MSIDFKKLLAQAAEKAGVSIEFPEVNPDEYMENRLKRESEASGNLNESDGINCDKCKNRGYIPYLEDGFIRMRMCECMKQRKEISRIRESGLGKLIDEKRFDNFLTDGKDDWRTIAKARCMRYAEAQGKEWLYVGGQSGCGKTHLCTAVCRRLISRGFSVKYFLWMDLMNEYNNARFDEEKHNDFKYKIASADVLYIDDFLKTMGGGNERNTKPSDASLAAAYEIVTARDNAGKRTIISSEFLIEDIATFDRATAGRIVENTPGSNKILVRLDKEKDYRLK